MKKRILSMLMIAVMMIQLVGINNFVYAEPGIFNGGTGTAEDPYQISTEAQLVAFRDSVTVENRYFDKYVVLTNDITMTTPWVDVSIGHDQFDGFGGHFDGNGYSIINFTLSASTSGRGLFGYVDTSASIQHLAMENVTITATGDSYYIGAVAGENRGIIKDAYVTGTLTRSSGTGYNLGGIAGTNFGIYAFISNCYTNVTIDGFHVIGGIVGNNNDDGTVANCFSLGTVNYIDGYESAEGAQRGAIAGYVSLTSVTTKNYYMNNQAGTVTAVADFAASVPDGDNYYLNTATSYKTTSFFNDADSWSGTYPWDFMSVWTTNLDAEYPTFKPYTEPVYNPVSNKIAGNYTILFGEENSIKPGNVTIPNGMVIVSDFINNLTIEAGSVYKIFPMNTASLIVDYSGFDVATGKDANAVLVNNDVLIVYNAAHSKSVQYTINTDLTGNKINNGKLRFGNGSENSINAKGGLQQPFYYNQDNLTWRKLTYNVYPLNYAIGIGGESTVGWNNNGTSSIDQNWTGPTISYNDILNGSGVATATGTLTIDGKTVELTNRYELQAGSSFIKITSTVRNPGETSLQNVRYWTGTQDDYVGGSDSPTKTKGNLVSGVFTANNAVDQQAKALKIESGSETVLFFSTHASTEMVLNQNLNFNEQLSIDPRSNPFTMTGDDSYGMFVKLGDIAPGASSSFTWYYAAGSAADITEIIGDVDDEVSESLSSDATLTTLVPSAGSLSPDFASGTTSYTINVGNEVSSIALTPTASDAGATIKVNDQNVTSGQASQNISLTVGNNTLVTRVIAEDATEKLYTVTVIRADIEIEEEQEDTNAPTNVIVIVNGQVQNAGSETKTIIDGQTVVTVSVNNNVIESKIDDAIKNNPTGTGNVIQVPVADTRSSIAKVELTGDIVKKLEENNFQVSVKRDAIEYILPAEELTIGKIAESLGVKQEDLKNIKFEVQITNLDTKVTAKYNEVAKANGAELIFPPVAFEIVAKTTKTDGTTSDVAINKFSNYVERVMEIPAGVDPSKITTGIVFNSDGTYSHVPTEVFQKDGKWYAKLNSLTNSNYSVVWNPIVVKSVEKHWSKDAVNDMASRLVVFNAESFEPNKAITRADFAEYIVRALGLYREGTKLVNNFTDVNENSDRTLAIAIANEYGIITGYPDGTFRPNALITREEAMAMYQKAMLITKLVGSDNSRYMNYTDYNQVGKWATDYVEAVLSAHVFNGKTTTTISPKANLTYAEAAQAIKNLLVESKLINN